MNASTPHVSRPPRRHATIGKQPPGPRASNAGPRRADAEVEHAAGAERDLRQTRAGCTPGRRATPAGRRRGPRSAARRAARTPRRRRRSSRRSWAAPTAGCGATSSTCGAQPDPSACSSPVSPALVVSVTCSAPTRAARQRPRDPAVDRAEAEVAGAVGVGHVEQERELGGRHVRRRRGCPGPAARGTCSRCAGPASRCPGRRVRPWRGPRRSSTPRWLAMPTASTGPPASSSGAGDVERRRRHGGRVELHEARARASRAAPRGSGRGRRWRRAARSRHARRSCRRRRRGCSCHRIGRVRATRYAVKAATATSTGICATSFTRLSTMLVSEHDVDDDADDGDHAHRAERRERAVGERRVGPGPARRARPPRTRPTRNTA